MTSRHIRSIVSHWPAYSRSPCARQRSEAPSARTYAGPYREKQAIRTCRTEVPKATRHSIRAIGLASRRLGRHRTTLIPRLELPASAVGKRDAASGNRASVPSTLRLGRDVRHARMFHSESCAYVVFVRSRSCDSKREKLCLPATQRARLDTPPCSSSCSSHPGDVEDHARY